MSLRERAGVFAFLREFSGDWFGRMSGGASVPLAILALYVSSDWQKGLFGALAILCLLFSSYRVWRRERLERLRLVEVLTPRLVVLFEPKCRDCSYSEDDSGDYHIRLGIANRGGAPIENVSVYLDALEPGIPAGRRQLRWTGTEQGTSVTLTQSAIGHHHVELLAWLFDSTTGKSPCFLGIAGGYFLDDNKEYRATLSVEGNTPPVVVEVRIRPGAKAPNPTVEILPRAPRLAGQESLQ